MWNNTFVYDMSWDPPLSWPNVTFNTPEGHYFTLTARDYIGPVDTGNGLAWQNQFYSSTLDFVLLGAAAMGSQYWVFDIGNHTLSFAPAAPQPKQSWCPHR